MKWSITIILLIVPFAASSANLGSRLFECDIKHAASPMDNSGGELKPDNLQKGWIKEGATINFDGVSGFLRFGSATKPRKYEVLQKGDGGFSLLAVHSRKIGVRTVLEVFRIQTWEENMRFLWIDETRIYSGNCRVLR